MEMEAKPGKHINMKGKILSEIKSIKLPESPDSNITHL